MGMEGCSWHTKEADTITESTEESISHPRNGRKNYIGGTEAGKISEEPTTVFCTLRKTGKAGTGRHSVEKVR